MMTLAPERARPCPHRPLNDSSSVKQRFQATRVIPVSSPTDGYLVWLSGRENPVLPIMIMASLLSANPLQWIDDQRVVEHLQIPFRGFAEYIYGDLVNHELYGQYFRLCPPKEAKHLLVRVRWSANSMAYKRGQRPNLVRHTAKYFAKTTPDQKGIGYDFWVVPVWHQSGYDPEHKAEHDAFVQASISRYQARWDRANLRPQHLYPRQNSRTPLPKRHQARAQRRPAKKPPETKASLLPQVDELRKRAWALYTAGYKKLKLKAQDQNFEFLQQAYPYTRLSVSTVNHLLGQYEQDAQDRAAVHRDFIGLKTAFAMRNRRLDLDVWQETDGRMTLGVQLGDDHYHYSQSDLDTLRNLLRSIS